MSRLPRNTSRAALLALTFALAVPACRKSPTAKQIKGFADKVCACQDAACAEAVQGEYLEWWKGNMRARGSESDRKGVEKAMQRYAECHLKLVGPESPTAPAAPAVPKVNLQPVPVAPAAPAEEAGSAAPGAPASGETAGSGEAPGSEEEPSAPNAPSAKDPGSSLMPAAAPKAPAPAPK